MTIEDFNPGDFILFMKVGTHANERLEDIVERKQREIDDAGYALWGYGGNTCHPTTIVQPFARAHEHESQPIRLVMHEMNSNHLADPIRATHLSTDGSNWEPIPDEINALGSRYALCIKELREIEATVNLANTRVALGNSKGKSGDEYVQRRVDKACLEVVSGSHGHAESAMPINLVAELVTPYAVFLRND